VQRRYVEGEVDSLVVVDLV